MAQSPTELLLAALAAAGVGIVAGVFGIGGGFLLIPVLNIVLKVPMHWAVGSTACQLLGPATTIVLSRRVRPDDFRLPLVVTGGLLIGVMLGADVLHQSIRMSDGDSTADIIVLSVYVCLLAVLGAFSLFETSRAAAGVPIPRLHILQWPIPPRVALSSDFRGPVSVTVLAWFGLLVGFISGLIGISGGLLVLPGLIYLMGLTSKRAVVNSIIIVWLVAAQSTVVHAWLGHVQLPLAIALMIGGTIGARLGSEIGQRISGRSLRRNFGWLTLATAALSSLQLVRLLSE